MPPFRTGPIEVDPRFDGEALHELRDIGHDHRINIVDASYDIPRGARTIKFPGGSADALLGVARLIPVESKEVTLMDCDQEEPEGSINMQASEAFDQALQTLHKEGIHLLESYTHRMTVRGFWLKGFYEIANQSSQPKLFIRTIDDLPFACASLVAGHSQRTEQNPKLEDTGPFHGQRTP